MNHYPRFAAAYLIIAMLAVAACGRGNSARQRKAGAQTPPVTLLEVVPNPVVGALPATLSVYSFAGIAPMLEAKPTMRNDDNDTTYVVNFWATWCKPCVEELPAFEQLHREGGRVRVLLVSLDSRKTLTETVFPFVAREGITAPIVVLSDPDANAWIPRVDTTWSGALPCTVVFKGHRRRFYERTFTYEGLREAVR